MPICWSVDFVRSYDLNRKDMDGIGYRTSECGAYLLPIGWIDYINLKRLQQREMACRTYSEGRRDQSSLRCKILENTWIQYTRILQATPAMFILGCAQTALVFLECLEDNTRFGQSSWRLTTFHQRCVWKENSFSWV